MLQLFLVSIGLMAIAFLLLGIRIFFVKGGKFPNTSIGGNKALRAYGITCAKHEEWAKFRKMQKRKINPNDLTIVIN